MIFVVRVLRIHDGRVVFQDSWSFGRIGPILVLEYHGNFREVLVLMRRSLARRIHSSLGKLI